MRGQLHEMQPLPLHSLPARGYAAAHESLTSYPAARGDTMKATLLAVLALATLPASAQQVYKCVDGKNVSYQSTPCAGAQKYAKEWNATPEPPPTNDELWRRYHAKKKGERESAYLRQLAGRENLEGGQTQAYGTPIPAQSASNRYACETAKRHREATLKAVGIDRTHDLLRSLDDAVNRACK